MTWTWVEPFAGAAACALRLVGGKRLVPPCSWMGGKRKLARAILDAMGVPAGPPTRVVLADAGPWGWVWPLLLEPGAAARVAAVLRSWSGEHPRDLWQRLAAQPPAEDVHERAAQWLWLQARSASGVPIWWDGWRLEAGNGKTPTDRGEDLRWPAHQAERARWRQADHATGRDMAAGQSGRGWLQGKSEGRTSAQAPWQKGGWRFDARPGDAALDRPAGPSGQTNGRTGGMVNPATIAERIEAVAQAFGGRWVASDGRGDPRPAGMKPDERHDGVRRSNGIMDPAVVAGRVEALGAAGRGVHWSVHHGDARELRPVATTLDVGCPKCQRPAGERCVSATGKRAHHARLLRSQRESTAGAFVYLDPPYLGATGYGWDLERGLVLELAIRWRDAGAVVAVSEAVPLDLPGWHHVDLTREGGKPEHLTLSRPPARLPQRQGSLFAEGA